jgi:hypothetical protein
MGRTGTLERAAALTVCEIAGRGLLLAVVLAAEMLLFVERVATKESNERTVRGRV